MKSIMAAIRDPDRIKSGIGRRMQALSLAQGVRSRDNAKKGPVEVQIGISNRCNNRCVTCWPHKKNQEAILTDKSANIFFEGNSGEVFNSADMPLDVFEAVAADLKRIGTKRIYLIGKGEPLLNPHFVEIASIVKDAGMICFVSTNGVLLSPEIMDQLIDIELDELNISLNAASQDIYEKFHNQHKQDGLRKICESVTAGTEKKRRLGKIKPVISFSFVISSLNSHEILDMVRLSVECGVDKVNIARLYAFDSFSDLLMTEEQNEVFNSRLGEVRSLLDARGIAHNVSSYIRQSQYAPDALHPSENYIRKYPCYAGWTFCVIYADGTVSPCCSSFIKLGNVNEQSFRKIWNGEKYGKFRNSALSLPKLTGNVPGCLCDRCGYINTNAEFHELLKPYRDIGYCKL